MESTHLAHLYALDPILPACTRLVVDPSSHVALLLYVDAEVPLCVLHAVRLTPSASDLLLALLQAYPDHCPYRTLFAALYPMDPWDRQLATRPIRRAVVTLSRALQHLGLAVIALRRRGYVLTNNHAVSIEPLIRLRVSQWIAAQITEGSPKKEQNHG